MFGRRIGIELGRELGIDLGTNSDATSLGPSDLVSAGNRIAWFKSDTGVTSAASRISAWGNVWTNGDLAQATGANQMLLTANALGSYPAVQADSVSRYIAGTLGSPLLSGERMYQWVFLVLPAVADASRSGTAVASGDFSRSSQVRTSTTGPGKFSATHNVTGATLSVDGPNQDTSPHLIETGTTANGAEQLVVSGTAFSGAALAAHNANLTTLQIGNATSSVVGQYFEWIVHRGEPTAYVKMQMRRYFQARYGTI